MLFTFFFSKVGRRYVRHGTARTYKYKIMIDREKTLSQI